MSFNQRTGLLSFYILGITVILIVFSALSQSLPKGMDLPSIQEWSACSGPCPATTKTLSFLSDVIGNPSETTLTERQREHIARMKDAINSEDLTAFINYLSVFNTEAKETGASGWDAIGEIGPHLVGNYLARNSPALPFALLVFLSFWTVYALFSRMIVNIEGVPVAGKIVGFVVTIASLVLLVAALMWGLWYSPQYREAFYFFNEFLIYSLILGWVVLIMAVYFQLSNGDSN